MTDFVDEFATLSRAKFLSKGGRKGRAFPQRIGEAADQRNGYAVDVRKGFALPTVL